jgi:hypothetical protein
MADALLLHLPPSSTLPPCSTLHLPPCATLHLPPCSTDTCVSALVVPFSLPYVVDHRPILSSLLALAPRLLYYSKGCPFTTYMFLLPLSCMGTEDPVPPKIVSCQRSYPAKDRILRGGPYRGQRCPYRGQRCPHRGQRCPYRGQQPVFIFLSAWPKRDEAC